MGSSTADYELALLRVTDLTEGHLARLIALADREGGLTPAGVGGLLRFFREGEAEWWAAGNPAEELVRYYETWGQ